MLQSVAFFYLKPFFLLYNYLTFHHYYSAINLSLLLDIFSLLSRPCCKAALPCKVNGWINWVELSGTEDRDEIEGVD